jgi:hypothetical protein
MPCSIACGSHAAYSRSMARIKMTAAVHRRISRRDLLAALRHARLPLDVHRNRAYFVGVDSRGREFEIVLAADDGDDDLWHAIHALQARYQKNW